MADAENPIEEKESQTDQTDTTESTEEASEFDCSIKVEDSGAWKKKVVIEIPRAEINKELDKQYGEFRHSADVPGFRKGRAPRRLLEKRFGSDITEQTKLRLMAQAFEQVDEKQDFDILGEPDFDPEKVEMPDDGDLTFEYEVEVKPVFELPELENVKIEKPLHEVTPERIDETLNDLCKRAGEMIELDGKPAQADDMVTADVSMKVEGVDEPETQEDCPVRVGSAAVMGVLVEDMGDVLAGAKPGDTLNCSAEISDTHANEDYRGKKADFTITVKAIRRLIPAEMNEEFFKNYGVSDESDLRQQIEDGLESQTEREVRDLMRQQVFAYLNDEIDFELPAGVAARHASGVLQRRYYDLLNKGIPQDQITENLDRLRAASSEQASQELKMNFILEQVAEKLEITASEAEVNGFIAQVAARYDRRPERVRDDLHKEGRLESLTRQIRDEKAIDRILEMAEVVDAPVVPPEDAAKSKKAPAKAKKASKKAAKAPKGDAKDAPSTDAEKPSAAAESDQPDAKTAPASAKTPKAGEKKNETEAKTARKQVKRKPPQSDT